MRRWPELEVYVHERGAPHLIDPSRLLASAERLYGDQMERLWGEIVPVPGGERAGRWRGGETVLGMRVAYTPGHASHHVCYLHEESGTAFVGDVAAVLHPAHRTSIVPPTPPPDIDIETWEESIAIVEGWRPERLALTHFGAIEDPAEHLADGPRAPARGGRAGPRARRGRLRGAPPRRWSPSRPSTAEAAAELIQASRPSTSGAASTATGASARSASGGRR